jgi:Carboxypeptidase regulatory-like domain
VTSLRHLFVAAALGAFASASVIAAVSPNAAVAGTVTLTAADGATFAGSGARVVLACLPHGTMRTEVADERGAFRFLNVPVAACSIEADMQGFAAQTIKVVTTADRIAGTDFHLTIAPLRVGVKVGGGLPCHIERLKESSAGC